MALHKCNYLNFDQSKKATCVQKDNVFRNEIGAIGNPQAN